MKMERMEQHGRKGAGEQDPRRDHLKTKFREGAFGKKMSPEPFFSLTRRRPVPHLETRYFREDLLCSAQERLTETFSIPTSRTLKPSSPLGRPPLGVIRLASKQEGERGRESESARE